MNWNIQKIWPTAAMSLVAITTLLSADNRKNQNKYEKNGKEMNKCGRIGICGPSMMEGVNPSARPLTEDPCCCEQGEFSITVAGFYWQATEDGLEYAIEDKTVTDTVNTTNLATLVDAHFLTPDFKWRPGFKVGIGYNGTHDGWDLELLWTHFNGRGHDSEDADTEDLISALPLWSDYSPPTAGLDTTGGTILHATETDASWRVDLNIVDFELGREFWTSKYLTLRPFIGVRYASINQHYTINNYGGTWDFTSQTNEIIMKNNFGGAGVRGGLNTVWNFGCCDPCAGNWGIFGNVALSLIYGKFHLDQDEYNRAVSPSFQRSPILQLNDRFTAARAILDLALGIEWSTVYHNGEYAFNIALAWEQHHFFNQNQLWRVNNIGDNNATPALHGENVYHQTRGDLSTQGVTLTLDFTF